MNSRKLSESTWFTLAPRPARVGEMNCLQMLFRRLRPSSRVLDYSGQIKGVLARGVSLLGSLMRASLKKVGARRIATSRSKKKHTLLNTEARSVQPRRDRASVQSGAIRAGYLLV